MGLEWCGNLIIFEQKAIPDAITVSAAAGALDAVSLPLPSWLPKALLLSLVLPHPYLQPWLPIIAFASLNAHVQRHNHPYHRPDSCFRLILPAEPRFRL